MGEFIKKLPAKAGDTRDSDSIHGSGRSPGGGTGNTPVFFPGEFQGQRILMNYSQWGRKKSDMIEHSSKQTNTPLEFPEWFL